SGARAGPPRQGRQARRRPAGADRALRQPASRARGQGDDAPAGVRRAGRPRRRAARRPGNGERDYRRRSDGRRRAGRRRGGGPGGGFGVMKARRYRVVDFLGFTPLSHRPPLPKRWWVYCGVAFLAPSLVLQLVPATEVPYRDLVWLLTLVPAYLLSLHYGLRGAVAGLAMGTVLFTSIQFLVALNLEPEDWRITVPIYVSYGVIAISVGWLSEQLHLFYARAIQGERVAVISQVALTMRHEVNNALATILAEGELLEADAVLTHPEDKESLQSILRMTRRIRDSMDKLVHLSAAPTTEYAEGVAMIDLTKLKTGGGKRGAGSGS